MFPLNLLLGAVFAQDTAPWNPTDHPIETVTPPITVHATTMLQGRTRLEVINNTKTDLMVKILTQGLDKGFVPDNGLRILKEQVDELCPINEANTTRNKTWDYADCMFTMTYGQQIDIVIVPTLGSANEGEIGPVVVAFPVVTPPEEPKWAYFIQKPIIIRNTDSGIIPPPPEE